MNGVKCVKLGLAIIAIGAFILGGYGIYVMSVPTIVTVALAVMGVGAVIIVATIILEG